MFSYSQPSIMHRLAWFYRILVVGIISHILIMPLQANEWKMQGSLQATLFGDTIYRDPYIQADRTPVFGHDGSENLDADNSCIPTKLEDGVINMDDCRDLYLDGPEFGGSLVGSHMQFSFDGQRSAAMMELGLYSFTDPYTPELAQLWLLRGPMKVGYGLSAFADPLDYVDSFTLDYGGPIGEAYRRQLGIRFQLSQRISLAFEDPQHEVYLGLRNSPDDKNSNSIKNPRVLSVQISTSGADSPSQDHRLTNTYEVTNRLRDRATMPDMIVSYQYDDGPRSFLGSLLIQYVRLDNNAPLFLDEDPGFLALIDDAARIEDPSITTELDQELRLNDDLSGGMYNLNLGMHLGADFPLSAGHRMHLAYILNGGSYLRDNPNPAHVVVPDFYNCHLGEDADCDYSLVSVVSHSYLINFDFANHIGWVLSGTFTDDEYANYLGGDATEQLHSMHLNYRQNISNDIASAYEVGYLYHRTFNTRSNADYPRLRFQYRLFYVF